MSKYRTTIEAKKANPKKFALIKGPNGRNLCRYCQTEVKPPRRTFCSKECVHEWSVRTNTRYARACVIRRDKYICQICGVNCQHLRKELRDLPLESRLELAKKLGIPKHRLKTCLFDIDHIKPVVENGGCCGLENLRLLCIPCHKKVTAELRTRLASKSDKEK